MHSVEPTTLWVNVPDIVDKEMFVFLSVISLCMGGITRPMSARKGTGPSVERRGR